ncbi:MAG: uracil phosphoribosyltransferase, partial [Ferruginibacter sp.]
MIINLGEQHSLVSNWVSELRDQDIQTDQMRFRRNLERIGEVAAYEISKRLAWEEKEITTPLGIATCKVLRSQPVLATILRAGLGMHTGLLNYFDKGENAFISAYRKHNPDGSFTISLEYMSCPEIDDKVVIISDPMIATGSSLVKVIQYLKEEGDIKELHIVCA